MWPESFAPARRRWCERTTLHTLLIDMHRVAAASLQRKRARHEGERVQSQGEGEEDRAKGAREAGGVVERGVRERRVRSSVPGNWVNENGLARRASALGISSYKSYLVRLHLYIVHIYYISTYPLHTKLHTLAIYIDEYAPCIATEVYYMPFIQNALEIEHRIYSLTESTNLEAQKSRAFFSPMRGLRNIY